MTQQEHSALLKRVENIWIDVYMSLPPYRHPYANTCRKAKF